MFFFAALLQTMKVHNSMRRINKQLIWFMKWKMFFTISSSLKLFHQRYQHINGQLNAPVFSSYQRCWLPSMRETCWRRWKVFPSFSVIFSKEDACDDLVSSTKDSSNIRTIFSTILNPQIFPFPPPHIRIYLCFSFVYPTFLLEQFFLLRCRYRNMFVEKFTVVYSFIEHFFCDSFFCSFAIQYHSLFYNLHRTKRAKESRTSTEFVIFFPSKLLTMWTVKYKWWCCFLESWVNVVQRLKVSIRETEGAKKVSKKFRKEFWVRN